MSPARDKRLELTIDRALVASASRYFYDVLAASLEAPREIAIDGRKVNQEPSPVNSSKCPLASVRLLAICLITMLMGSTANGQSPAASDAIAGIDSLPFNAAISPEGAPYIRDEIVVRYLGRLSDAAQLDKAKQLGTIKHHYRHLRAFWIALTPGTDAVTLCQELNADVSVEYAHLNYIGQRSLSTPVIPNDPSFGSCWGLNNTGQTIPIIGTGAGDADIDAPEAWCVSTDATNTLIGIVDSGCFLQHQDLSSNVWTNPVDPVDGIDNDSNGFIDDINGWDFNALDNIPEDLDGHGTLVTGVACAEGNNGIGTTGVCWTSRFVTCKDGNSFPTIAASAAGFEYCVSVGCSVINFSTGYSLAPPGIMVTAVDNARLAGTIIVCAAPNSPVSIEGGVFDTPAEMTQDNLLVVTSTNNLDNLSSTAGFGSISVDIGAPGDQIFTTTRTGGYGFTSGVSFATPMVVGALALARSNNATLSYSQLISLATTTGDSQPTLLATTTSGVRLNLDGLLSAIGGGVQLDLSTTGIGDVTIALSNATANQLFYLPVSINTPPTTTGPIFGLPIDALTTMLIPLPPFRGTTNGNGAFSFNQPGGLAPGLFVQARAAYLDPTNGLTLSNFASITF